MQRRSIVCAALGVLGASALAVAAVRTGVLWLIDPVSDAFVLAAALLLAAGAVVGTQALRLLRGHHFRTAGVLAVVAAVLWGAGRLSFEVSSTPSSGGVLVPYGPGSPPSISWTLLWWQVGGPALAGIAVLLLVAALVAVVAGVARTVSNRLHTV